MARTGASDQLITVLEEEEVPGFSDPPTRMGDSSGSSIQQWLSPVAFWLPEYMDEQSAWIEHAPFAFWLVDALKPGVFVELGTFRGYSYLAVCQAVQRLGLKTCCYAVDTWKGDQHAGFYDESILIELQKYHDPRYSSFSSLLRSTFDDALDHFEDRTIDLLHIDGRHFYDDVKHDFESWLPKLSHRGIVLIHDTNVRELGFGVQRYWRELKVDYPHFEFFHGHGLGILSVGDLEPRLRGFFDSCADLAASTEIRAIYSRLGRAIVVEADINEALTQRDELRKALAERQEVIIRRDAEIVKLRQRVTQRDAAIKNAKRQTAKLSLRLHARKTEMAALRRSKSWKITAPLRRMGAVLRSLTNRIGGQRGG